MVANEELLYVLRLLETDICEACIYIYIYIYIYG